MDFESVEHVGILMALLATSFGLFKGVSGWRRERDAAHNARVRQQQQLEEVLAEFKPNHGGSLVDKIAAMHEEAIEHIKTAESVWADNRAEHEEFRRRIDGIFELIAGRGVSQLRREAENHKHQREEQA